MPVSSKTQVAVEGGSSAGYHTLPDGGQNRFSEAHRHVSAKRIYVRQRGKGASTRWGWEMGGRGEWGRSEWDIGGGEIGWGWGMEA